MGINDDLITYIDTGKICRDAGAVMIALHARTAQQHYAPSARWEAIATLKQQVEGIPVLGNGDIWCADECFLTGSGAEVIPVVKLDGRVIGSGKPGPITHRVLEAFRRRVLIEGTRI